MLKNFDKTIKNIDGSDIVENGKTAKMSTAICNALMVSDEGSGEEKLQRYNLAVKINAGGDIDLSVNDCHLIKRLVEKYHGPLIVGQIIPILDKDPE